MICSLRQKRWISSVSLLLMMGAFLYLGSRSGAVTGAFFNLSASHAITHSLPVQHLHQHRPERFSLVQAVTESDVADKTAHLCSDLLDHPFFLMTLSRLETSFTSALEGLRSEPAKGLRDGITVALRTVVLLD